MALAPPASPSLALAPLPVDWSWLGGPDQGAQGEEGLVRATRTSWPARARACDLCPALWESLGSLSEFPLHAKRQRRGVDGSLPP